MKKYRFYLALLILCLFLAGCGKVKESEVLSEEKIAEIVTAWEKKTGSRTQWDGVEGYYGTYQDVVVFNENGFDYGALYMEAYWEINVGGEVFPWPNSFQIYTYSDGKFYELETAYKDGLITKENLERIADYHYEYLADDTLRKEGASD